VVAGWPTTIVVQAPPRTMRPTAENRRRRLGSRRTGSPVRASGRVRTSSSQPGDELEQDLALGMAVQGIAQPVPLASRRRFSHQTPAAVAQFQAGERARRVLAANPGDAVPVGTGELQLRAGMRVFPAAITRMRFHRSVRSSTPVNSAARALSQANCPALQRRIHAGPCRSPRRPRR
jgi:hypothetical protein